MNFGIGSAFSKCPGSTFSEGPSTSPSPCSLKLFLTVPAVSVIGLTFCKAKFLMNVNGTVFTQNWQKKCSLHLMQRTD